MATPIVVIVFKCRKICQTGNRWNRALFSWPGKKQNLSCLSNCRYCADRAKNLPMPDPNNVLTVLRTSSKSVHFRRSYSRMREHRFCPVEYYSPEDICFASGEWIITSCTEWDIIIKLFDVDYLQNIRLSFAISRRLAFFIYFKQMTKGDLRH